MRGTHRDAAHRAVVVTIEAVLATRNDHKVDEVGRILRAAGIDRAVRLRCALRLTARWRRRNSWR